jgi:hypothetical protein
MESEVMNDSGFIRDESDRKSKTIVVPKKNIDPPSGYAHLHPALVENNEIFKDLQDIPVVQSALRTIDTGRETLDESWHRINNPDPTQPRAAHLEAWEKNSMKRVEEVRKRMERTEEIANTHMETVQNEINALLQETPRASEIRSYIRSLEPEQRTAVLGKALENADHETMAALVSGPAYLSGLDEKQRETMKDGFLKRNAPKEYRQREAIKKARELAKKAYTATLEGVGELTPAQEMAKYRKQKQKAEAGPVPTFGRKAS